MQPRRSKRPRARGGRSKLKILTAVLAVVLAAGLLAALALAGAADLMGLDKSSDPVDVTIEQGMSFKQIAQLLEKRGVVSHGGLFYWYARLRGGAQGIQAGDYLLTPSGGYDGVLNALVEGDTAEEVVTLTFYEGMTMRDISLLLEKEGVCSAAAFIQAVEGEDFGFEFEQMLPRDKENRFRLKEGYLFPDTYDFFKGEAPRSVARKFLRNFDSKLGDELIARMGELNLTLDEAVTLASIIQKEAGLEEEMVKVSSVFHNRLDTPEVFPKLESDVTRDYVNDDIKPYMQTANQPLYDAYNTYVCRGLPVGPICSPGLAAIRAALEPADTGYYFFVTDVNGKYYYSETADEHYANVRLAFSVGPIEHGTGTEQP